MKYLAGISFEEFKSIKASRSTQHPKKKETAEEVKSEYKFLVKFCKDSLKNGGRGSDKKYSSKYTERLYGKDSIQGISKVFKGFLLQDICFDVDAKNNHPVNIEYRCKEVGINVPVLSDYNKRRNQIIKENPGVDIKHQVLEYMNGSKARTTNEFLKKIKLEFETEVRGKLVKHEKFKHLKDYFRTDEGKCDSLVFRIAEELEAKVINDVVIPYLESVGLEPASVMHDGVVVYNGPNGYHGNNELLRELEVEVEKAFPGLGLEFDYKEFDKTCQLPNDFDEEKCKHLEWDFESIEGIVKFLKDHKDYFCYSNDSVWAKKSSGTWSNNPASVKNTLYYMMGEIVNTLTQNACKTMISHIENDHTFFINDIESLFVTTTKGYLPFLNGVINLKDMRVLSYDDESLKKVYFKATIAYNYEEPSQEVIDFVNEVVVDTTFHCDDLNTDAKFKELCKAIKREFFWYCSRFLGGNILKYYLMADGDRDCGKGLLTLFFKHAFGFFTGSFDIDNIMKTKSHKDDRKTWLVPFVEKRLVFNNEIDITGAKLSGKELKSIASGGDDVSIRKMTCNTTNYSITAGMISFQQELPEIDDSCAYDTLLYMMFPCSFVDDLSTPKNSDGDDIYDGSTVKYGFKREKREDIKDIIKDGYSSSGCSYTSNQIKCAFVRIVMEHYNQDIKPTNFKLKAKELKKGISVLNPEQTIKNNFKVSNDITQTSELISMFRDLDIQAMTTQKVSQIMNRLFGLSSEKIKSGPNKDLRGYRVKQIKFQVCNDETCDHNNKDCVNGKEEL